MLLGPTFVWDFLWAHLPCLLDLRFADDIILFARDEREAMALLESLVSALGKTGLRLNVAKKISHQRRNRPHKWSQQMAIPSRSLADLRPTNDLVACCALVCCFCMQTQLCLRRQNCQTQTYKQNQANIRRTAGAVTLPILPAIEHRIDLFSSGRWILTLKRDKDGKFLRSLDLRNLGLKDVPRSACVQDGFHIKKRQAPREIGKLAM